MKTIIKYITLFIALGFCLGCDDSKQEFDTDITVIVDKTSKMTAYPSADEIGSYLVLKENPWQGVRVTVTYISDKDINDVTVLTLNSENQWSGNILMRKAKVQHFVKQLQQCLSEIKTNSTCPYSIIYPTIARQVNTLASSLAQRKLILIYSDLYENDNAMDFYDPKAMNKVLKDPHGIAEKFQAGTPIKPLNGIQAWLIYSPISFEQNNRYMAIASIYKKMFEAKGAIVHIGNSLTL